MGGGTAIHSGLGINVGGNLYPLRVRQRAALRNKLSEVRLLIIEETSTVSSVLFSIQPTINEIFGYSGEEPFAGLPIIVCADFYQLFQVKCSPIYSSVTSIKGFLVLIYGRSFRR